jgi:drug/metabolite transporter (DMT)-like permease
LNLVLKEKFRKKDLLGIALSIIGAVIVVLSAKSQNQSVRPDTFAWLDARHALIGIC